MVEPVDSLIPMFAKAGADYITFHCEASRHIDRTLSLIRDNGCKAGLVFNPSTSLNYLEYVIDKIDLVLLMSVNPGFGGQSFIPSVMNKIAQAHNILDQHRKATGHEIFLEIDGGVKVENIGALAAAGADTFVAGSAIFGKKNPVGYKQVITQMRESIDHAMQEQHLKDLEEMNKNRG